MSEKRDPLEYVLNRMEAERDKTPPTIGYPPARKELLDGIAALRARVAELERVIREVSKGGVELEDEWVRYVAVQIDRETWAEVKALALAASEAKPAPATMPLDVRDGEWKP